MARSLSLSRRHQGAPCMHGHGGCAGAQKPWTPCLFPCSRPQVEPSHLDSGLPRAAGALVQPRRGRRQPGAASRRAICPLLGEAGNLASHPAVSGRSVAFSGDCRSLPGNLRRHTAMQAAPFAGLTHGCIWPRLCRELGPSNVLLGTATVRSLQQSGHCRRSGLHVRSPARLNPASKLLRHKPCLLLD